MSCSACKKEMWPFEKIYIRDVLARFSLMFITTYLTFCLLFVFPLSLGLEMAWVSLSWPETPCAWFSSCGLSLSFPWACPLLSWSCLSPGPPGPAGATCHLLRLCSRSLGHRQAPSYHLGTKYIYWWEVVLKHSWKNRVAISINACTLLLTGRWKHPAG